MKREILFRGKTKSKNSKWIYGDLNNVFCGVFIFDRVDESELNSPDNYEVIPETVGQFTGLTDKNGTKIFEGDILNYKDTLYSYDSVNWEVIFYSGAFFMAGLPRKIRIYHIGDRQDSIEVIGNIYDNPDLLKL